MNILVTKNILLLAFYEIIFCILTIPISFQVPLLLSIGEEDTALIKATESGDTDLVYLVLFHIWQKVTLPVRLKNVVFICL